MGSPKTWIAAVLIALSMAFIMAMCAYPAYSQQPLERHPYFYKPLPLCVIKDKLFKDLEHRLQHPVAWTGKAHEYGEVLVVFAHVENRTWFIVAMKIDGKRGCILSRGTEFLLIFGRPT